MSMTPHSEASEDDNYSVAQFQKHHKPCSPQLIATTNYVRVAPYHLN